MNKVKTALVLIDIQNDYFENGASPLKDSYEASLRAADILKYYRDNNSLIIHIQHNSIRPGSTFFLPGTTGAEIHPNVAPLKNEKIFTKYSPNSFIDTGLLNCLKENSISNIVFCGMMTHMCVDATVRHAKDLGFNCTIISDATATKDLIYKDEKIPADYVKKAFLSALGYFYADIITAREFLNQKQGIN